MALPAQTVSILQKAAVGDVVIGILIGALGLSGDDTGLLIAGAAVIVTGALMFLWARSQRPRPDGPIEGGPIGGSPIS